jgi:hypothetical protein
MTAQCIGCQHFNLRNAGQMARQGFGHCGLEPSRAVFQSAVFERQCRKFEAADPDTVDKRQAWLDWEKKRFLKEIGA